MRLVMMATGGFAVPTFRELYGTHHEIAALVTSPKRMKHGAGIQPAGPIRDLAHEHGTPILDPDNVNDPLFQRRLSGLESDLLVVCDYGQILSPTTLAAARLGGINLHASLLPKYRGAAPVNWAVYHGEKETGATVIHMTPEVDAGPCIGQVRVSIDPDETAVELESRLSAAGSWLVRRAIDALEAGRLEAIPQDPAQASQAPRLKKTDGLVDWNRPATAIKDHVRAMEPWPKSYTFWRRKDARSVRLILGPVSVLSAAGRTAAPGTVLEAARDRLVVAAGEGAVALSSVQPSGKRPLPVQEFLRGYRVEQGDFFGPEGA